MNTDTARNETLETLRSFAGYQIALAKIAKQLHRLDECACNYGLTERQEKREARLEKEAGRIASFFGLKAYHQGDPRGGTLYLVPSEWTSEYADSHYTDGLYIAR